ncbi:MAG: GntR family transcriptional regulator [Oscillospiraceae bacterium]|nr:GntR family transcriptional regulator [Oscillospiraceae bacterium]
MLDIDLQSRIPIYEQLYKKVVELVIKKQYMPNDKLPSVRELAKELGVNPNTVSKAFQMLERDGIIYSLAGRGSFISDKNNDAILKNAKTNFANAVNEAFTAGLNETIMTDIIKEISCERSNSSD